MTKLAQQSGGSGNGGFWLEPYIPTFVAQSHVTVFPFENKETQKLACWYPAKQPADLFVKANNISQEGNDEKLFGGDRPIVTFYMPINQYHVAKTIKLKGRATIQRMFETLQAFIKEAISYYYGTNTLESVKMYESFITCHLMISRAGGYNKVYIRTPS